LTEQLLTPPLNACPANAYGNIGSSNLSGSLNDTGQAGDNTINTNNSLLPPDSVTIADNYFEGAGATAQTFVGSSLHVPATNIKVHHNHFNGTYLQVTDCTFCDVTDNTFENTAPRSSMNTLSFLSLSNTAGFLRHWRIQNNTFECQGAKSGIQTRGINIGGNVGVSDDSKWDGNSYPRCTTNIMWQAGQTAQPTVTVASGAGTSAAAAINNGTNYTGQLQVTTGTGSIATGTWATVNFSGTVQDAAYCTLVPYGSASGSLAAPAYVSALTPTTMTVALPNVTGVTASTIYKWNWDCRGMR
jgi:hypothetical protein